MPVKLGAIEDMTADEFAALRRSKGKQNDPAMQELLTKVEAGTPQRVALAGGQTARGLRVAIARKARERGLVVETVEGDGFVAVSRVAEGETRRGRTPATGGGERKRGRPPKRRERDEAEVAALESLALQES